MTDEQALDMWVIYEWPLDMCGRFVARRWRVSGEGPSATFDTISADSLEALRRALPGGLVRLATHPQDEPHIVETWI